MSNDANFTIRIGSVGEFTAVRAGTQDLKRATEAANEFGQALKLGFGIDIAGRTIDAISRIPTALEDAVKRGVDFNATIENTQTAVAAVLEKFQGLSRQDALATAGDAVEELKRKAVDAPGTVRQLAETWIASAGAASAANIPINQQIDLVVRLSQAVSRLALPQQQLVQETRALLTGNITLDAQLAKTLGINNEMIAQAKEQGNLYGFLVEKIGALGEASDTLEVRWSNLQDTIDQALGEATKPVFDALRDGILELNEALQQPETRQALKDLGHDVAGLVSNGLALTEWAIRNADSLMLVAKGAGLVAVALAAIKIKDILVGLGSMALGLTRTKTELDQESASLGRNTAAQSANAASRRANASASRSQSFLRGMAAGDMIPADMVQVGPSAAARRPGMIGSAFSNVAKGGGMLDALMLGTAGGWTIQDQWFNWLGSIGSGGATSSNDMRKAADRAGDTSLSKLFDRARNVSKPEDRDTLGQDVFDYLNSAKKERAGMSWNETNQKNVIDGDIKAAERLLASLDKITDAQLKQRDLAQAKADIDAADAAHAEEQAKNLAALDKYKQARGEAFYDKEQADQTRLAIQQAAQAADKGETSDALDRRRRELQDFLAKNPAITDQAAPTADVSRRDELRDAAQEQIKALDEAQKQADQRRQEARDQAEQEANEREIKALQEQLKLLEAQQALRLAEIEKAGGGEQHILDQRKAAEDEFSRQRLTLQDQIAARQGENATGTMARHTQEQADALTRANELQRAQSEAAATAWENATPKDGQIDARTQNVVGAMGAIYEHHGELQSGATRSAMGTLESPSMLSQMHGAGWDLPRLGDAMPPAAKPQNAPASNGAGADPGRAGADATAALHELSSKMQASFQQLLQEARQANGALTPAIAAVTTELRSLTQKIQQAQAQIRSLGSR